MTLKVGDKVLYRDQDNEPGQAAVVTSMVDTTLVDLLVRSSVGNDYTALAVAVRRGQPGRSFEPLKEADPPVDEKAYSWPTKADVKAEATLEAEAAQDVQANTVPAAEIRTLPDSPDGDAGTPSLPAGDDDSSDTQSESDKPSRKTARA